MLAEYGVLAGEAAGVAGGGRGYDGGGFASWAQSVPNDPVALSIAGAALVIVLYFLVFKR